MLIGHLLKTLQSSETPPPPPHGAISQIQGPGTQWPHQREDDAFQGFQVISGYEQLCGPGNIICVHDASSLLPRKYWCGSFSCKFAVRKTFKPKSRIWLKRISVLQKKKIDESDPVQSVTLRHEFFQTTGKNLESALCFLTWMVTVTAPPQAPTAQMIAKCMIPNSTYLARWPYTIILEGIYAPSYVLLVTQCASSPEHTANGGW